MRPAINIFSFQFIISTLRKKTTNGYVHQVLLLFLGKLFFYVAKFLDADKKENSFHIGFFTKSFNKFCFQFPPSCLQIIFCLHSDKDNGLNFVKTDLMDFTKDRFSISTEKEKMDIDFIHSFLTQSYWAEGISKEIIRRSIEGSLCFGVFENDKQLGFARMITDRATF